MAEGKKSPPSEAGVDSLDAAYEIAVKMVARKSRTCAEVLTALREKGIAADHAESAIGRMKAHRFLDDAQLADDQAIALIESKRMSADAAIQTLVARGVSSAQARSSVDAATEGRSESVLCERALDRRLKGRALPEKNAAKEARALTRLGYEEHVVARAIERALSKGEV